MRDDYTAAATLPGAATGAARRAAGAAPPRRRYRRSCLPTGAGPVAAAQTVWGAAARSYHTSPPPTPCGPGTQWISTGADDAFNPTRMHTVPCRHVLHRRRALPLPRQLLQRHRGRGRRATVQELPAALHLGRGRVEPVPAAPVRSITTVRPATSRASAADWGQLLRAWHHARPAAARPRLLAVAEGRDGGPALPRRRDRLGFVGNADEFNYCAETLGGPYCQLCDPIRSRTSQEATGSTNRARAALRARRRA